MDRREQKRQAQARYRKAHAERLSAGRRAAHVLVRQKGAFGDAKELAVLIHSLTGADFARSLARELKLAATKQRRRLK